MNDPHCPFCDTPLSEHPAGRCLDGWAAQLAGWRQADTLPPEDLRALSVHRAHRRMTDPMYDKGWLAPERWPLDADDTPFQLDPPAFSTETGDAMKLWREMREEGRICSLRAYTTARGPEIRARIGPVRLMACTEAHAITLAYIAARMAGKEK